MSHEPSFVPFALPDIGDREIQSVVGALRSGWLTTGPNTKAFEEEFSDFIGGGTESISVNSATAGLHLAVEAIGLGPGDEVLVPTWTFTSTAEVVRYSGATPVPVDVDPANLNLDLEAASSLVSSRTRAIIPVHFAGLPIDRSDLADFAMRNDLRVIEDAAHAFPAHSRGRRIGDSDSDAVVFSFYATKTITTGEGGMLVTRNSAIASRARKMRLHGIDRDVFNRYRSERPSWQYDVVGAGFKYNMTDIAAAMGRVQLQRARQMRDARASIARQYSEAFAGLPIDLPPMGDFDDHAWHLFVIRLRADSPISRDEFISRMASRGVGTSVHFTPLHMLTYWRESLGLHPGAFPVASQAFTQVVSLPLFSAMTSSQVERVIETTREAMGAA